MLNKLCIFIFATLLAPICFAMTPEESNISVVKNMFSDFAEKRDIKVIDDYYANDFVLVSNNQTYDYPTFKKQQEDIFKTLKSLQVLSYDDIFATQNKVVSRMAIKLTKKTGETHTFYVIAIIQMKDGKIARVWEITYPTWSDKLPTGK